MEIIKITTQAELDALPDKFDEYTRIQIYSPADMRIYVKKAWENSSVEAWGNSSVVARENSSVVARENSSVEARENSSVEAWENSSVEAWENSSVEARGNSSVKAWENSSVEAWGNSSVKSFESSILKCFSSDATVDAHHNAAIILFDCAPAIKASGNAQIITQNAFVHTIDSFQDIYPAEDGLITLYKSVRPDTLCDFWTGKVKYEGEVVCPDFDPDPGRECGGGLHLSPTPQLALQHNKGTVLICKVHVDDIVIYGPSILKVRCRKVTVVGPWQGGAS